MATAIPMRTSPPKSNLVKNDIADQDDAAKVAENKIRAHELWRISHKIGMAYRSDGAPTTEPIAAGAICYDFANDDLYVCVARNTPTWTILAE